MVTHKIRREGEADSMSGLECHHALDAISAKGTWIPISQMLSPSTEAEPSILSVVSGANRYDDQEIPRSVQILYTYVGTAHSGAYRPGMVKQPQDTEFVRSDPEWTYVFFRYVAKMLADGKLTGHPFEVVDGGLEGVGGGLKMLKAGQAKGFKYLFKVATASSN